MSAHVYSSVENKKKGKHSIEVDIDKKNGKWILWRAIVVDGNLKTNKGIHVGSTFADLIKAFPGKKYEKSGHYLIFRNPRISFRIEIPSAKYVTYLKTTKIPPESIISRIVIVRE